MTQLSPYLSFNDNCTEAMNFYKDCIGGTLTLQTVGESPMADKMPHMKDSVMHSSLVSGGITILASDMHREKLVEGNTIQLCINCSSEEETRSFFSNLAEGGQITEQLSIQFWGGLFGALTDKFGKNWIFNYEKNSK